LTYVSQEYKSWDGFDGSILSAIKWGRADGVWRPRE